jgi:hypothetical protein
MGSWLKWILAAVIFTALGAAINETGRSTVHRSAATASTVDTTAARPHRQRPRGHSRSSHATKTPAPAPTTTPTPSPFVACDQNISARAANTTCPFAENVFYEFHQRTFGDPYATNVRAWSHAAGDFFTLRCTIPDGVVCRSTDGAEVRFSVASVEAYTDEQAEAFAAAQDLGPEDDGPDDYSEPENYGGADDYGSNYGQNIPNYDDGDGDRVQCADGMYSHSGGIQGACSGHGGVG